MYEYMRGLQRQFCKEPDFSELRQELNALHRELTEDRPKDERRKLLKLVDLEAELRDETSRRCPPSSGMYPPAQL